MDAERALVALALYAPDSALAATCLPEHFEDRALAKLWRAIRERVQGDEPCDAMSLADVAGLDAATVLQLKGLVFSAGLQERDIPSYSEQVLDDNTFRRTSETLSSLLAERESMTGAALLSRAITDLGFIHVPTGNSHRVRDLCRQYIARWEELVGEDRTSMFVATGFDRLDALLNGGLRAGQMHVLGAATNVGKSSLANAIAINAAKAGHVVDVYGFEDDALNVLCRMVSRVADVENSTLQRFEAAPEDVSRGLRVLSELDINVIDRPPASLEQLTWQMRRSARVRGTGLIVVDYLQRIRGCPGAGIYDRMTAASGAMFEVARDTGAAVLICSQRNANEDYNRSLKGAGDIGEDAYTILLLIRRELFDDPPELTELDEPVPIPAVECWLTKQKNGSRGRVLLHHDATRATFYEADYGLRARYKAGKPL